MQLDSIMVQTTSREDVRRLNRAGGNVWQEYDEIEADTGLVTRCVLVRLPAAAAFRLGIVIPGADPDYPHTANDSSHLKRRKARRVTQLSEVS